ncbi:MAG TPA: family 20 glycosylhydrolase [Ruania sp.]|nr:family 20 glycosylhydrolase [Ruania sp.]
MPTSVRSYRHMALAAVCAAILMVLGAVAPTVPAQGTVPEEAELPAVIPSIDGWEANGGTFTAAGETQIVIADGDEALRATAQILRDELATVYPDLTITTGTAGAGDIELIVDPARQELGEEGYELDVGEVLTITAGTQAGAFYGTRTVSQMLTQQASIPQGAVTDIPAYAERGVTLCACVINISTDFIDRLIEQMSYLKLNTLMVELKLKVDAYPQTNTWSYYTKEDIAELVAKAERYQIEVIPEINSPGHMEIWLENMPELQLTNPQTGEKDEVRMDITDPDSFDFYTDLIDEYAEVFTSDYWHMGVDEYMLGSGYDNFPQILEFAHEKFGPEATEDDVVAWYVNKVNDYVQSKGMTLRIWNDGVLRDRNLQGGDESDVVAFDSDIVIEHWNAAGSEVSPQEFIDAGHQIVNVSNSLYMVRGGYGVDVESLYNNKWTPRQFFESEVTSGTDAIRGARISAWPDAGTPSEAENTTEERMFTPMNFLAQATWSESTPWESFDGFRSAMNTIGHPPLWNNVERQPLPEGTYEIASGGHELTAGDSGTVTTGDGLAFSITPTEDDYYVITAPDGRCLDVSREGTMRLEVPVEIGAPIELNSCADTTLQKWQLKAAEGGYHIVNAASQQYLSISSGLTGVPVSGEEAKDVPDGLVVQTPADWGQTVWSVAGKVGISAALDSPEAVAGESVVATVQVTNSSDTALNAAQLQVADLPEGWTAAPMKSRLEKVAPGATVSNQITLFNITGEGSGTVSFELLDGSGTVIASTQPTTTNLCAKDRIQPSAVASVSSQQPEEPGASGPAEAAIDGDPATYWHSQWQDSAAEYPHSIVVDLGEVQEVCGLWYTGRASGGSGGANGRIADYEVYTSTTQGAYDGDGWGEPVATGTFENTDEPQNAAFEPQAARYVKLVGLSEVHGYIWATAGEIAVAGPPATAPTFDPTVLPQSDRVKVGDYTHVTASGFAPGEYVSVSWTRDRGPERTKDRAEGYADASGKVRFRVHVTGPPGRYALTGTGATSGASAVGQLKATTGSGR